MGVKIAEKLEQFNNGSYYLVDSSAVEYVDKDGNVKSVKDVLDNGIGEGNTTDLTDIENRITTNEADITGLQEQIDNLDIPDLTDLENRITTNETNITDLQDQLDNLDIPDLTDLENRVTTNEADITGLQEQIDNLDIPDITEVNTKLTQLENKANFIPVIADNPSDLDLNNYIENGNYSIGYTSKYSNVPISRPALLTVIRSNSYRLQIYTVINNDDVYFRKSVDWGSTWSSWVLLNNSSGASDNGTNNDVYSTEEQAVGTWINGKTLYRRTIEDNTLRETGTDFIKLFDYSTNMKIVKFEGVVTLANANGQTFIRSLPYNKDGEEVYITKTTLDTLRLDSYLTNYKLGGYIVSVYYYKV